MSHGGNRPGSGRKLKYGEPVKNVTIKMPISKVDEIKEKIKAILKHYEVKDKSRTV